MRIGIDARELCGRATGVGRYLSGLLQAWARDGMSSPHEFLLYSSAPPVLPADGPFTTRILPGSGNTWWEQAQLPKAANSDGLDVFFAPGYTAPLRLRMPTVVAIHDVSFFARPEWFGAREGLRRRWLTAHTAARADRIVTISEFSRHEIVDHLGVPAARVRVIPPGIGDWVGRVASEPSTNPGIRGPLHRVLFVGSVFARRHVPELIRAFAPIARHHPSARLDIVGDNRSHPPLDLPGLIEREGLDRSVEWRAFVPDDELRGLYRNARAFAFLSEYEGLGLTPLEALSMGVPPLLLDTPVARESCGAAALYVDLDRSGPITEALEALIFDEALRARLLAIAPRVLARYDSAEAARNTLGVMTGAQ
jgi:glycosyltransferase involved in cell wall biosynthesis